MRTTSSEARAGAGLPRLRALVLVLLLRPLRCADDAFAFDSAAGAATAPQLFDVLRNDDSPALAAARGACVSSSLPPPLPPAQDSGVRFRDVAAVAGVRGLRPQTALRTSPNCLFDQFDRELRIWDAGTFCIPELLTGGAATGDVDSDGLPDLYVTRLDSADSLYLNRGGGAFFDASVAWGVERLTQHVRSNGVALIDIDNDGDLDIFISTVGDTRMFLLVSDGVGGLTEEAVERGCALVRSPHLPAGEGGLTSSFSVAVGDFDGDGWLDMYTTEWFPRQHLLSDPLAMGDAAAIDRVVTNKLLRNLGALGRPGSFEDVTLAAGIETRPRSARETLGSWLSPSNQLQLRLRMASFGLTEPEVSQRLAELNANALAFFPASSEVDEMAAQVLRKLQVQPRPTSAPFKSALQIIFPYVGVFTFCGRFVDLDGDGLQELVVSGDFGTSQLWWNLGNSSFSRGYFNLLGDLFDNSMGASVGDVDGDGRTDLLFMSMTTRVSARVAMDKFYPQAGIAASFEGNKLYLGRSRRQFEEVSAALGVKDTGWAWGGVLLDWDNDGVLDLAIANGMDDPETTDDDFAVNTPNAAFRGNRGGAFSPVAAQLGLDDRRDGRGYFEVDFDGDGDLDLFLVNHGDFPSLLRNDGGNAAGAWLRVRALEAACAGADVGPAASCTPRVSLGARVTVELVAGGRARVREVGSAAAFLSQGELDAHFGLGLLPDTGPEALVHSVTVTWPARGNASRSFRNVPARSLLVARAPARRGAVEPEENAAALPRCAEVQLAISRVLPPASASAEAVAAFAARVAVKGRFLSYRPAPGFEGVEVFTYEAIDGAGRAAGSASVRVTVAPAARSSSTLVSLPHSVPDAADSAASVAAAGAALFAPLEVPGSAVAALLVFSASSGPEGGRSVMRPYGGAPNHIAEPLLGASNTPYIRLAPPSFDDSLGAELSGHDTRPSARALSNVLATFPPAAEAGADGDVGPPFSEFVTYVFALLQHDLSSEAPLAYARMASAGADVRFNIAVPRGDPQWDPEGTGRAAMPFTRAPFLIAPSSSGATHLTSARNAINAASHVLDAEVIYGRPRDLQRAALIAHVRSEKENDDDEAAAQAPLCGALRLEPAAIGGGRELLLPLSSRPTGMVGASASLGGVSNAGAEAAVAANGDSAPAAPARRQLFQAGDERANLLPGLVVLHTLFAREHNRVLALLPPEDAEASIADSARHAPGVRTLCARRFARASAVVRAQLQAVVWHELLPALIGRTRFAALPVYKGFNSSVDPSVTAEFAAAAAFAWHAMLRDEVRALTPAFSARPAAGAFAGRFPLRDSYFAPQRALGGGLDPLLRGLWASRAQRVGARYCEAARQSFLGEAAGPGLDLAARDVQRGRDLGLPTFAAARAALGLAPIASFEALLARAGGPASPPSVSASAAAQHAAARLAALYNASARSRLGELDLVVGGLLEAPVAGGAVGETFAMIIEEQLLRTRDGDRFWLLGSDSASLQSDAKAAGLVWPLGANGLGLLIARNSGVKEAAGVGIFESNR